MQLYPAPARDVPNRQIADQLRLVEAVPLASAERSGSFMPSAIRPVRERARLSRQGDACLERTLRLAEVDRINDASSWYFGVSHKHGVRTLSRQGTKIQVRRCESKTLVHEGVKPCPATSCWRP